MNYAEGNVIIEDGTLIDKERFIYLAQGILVEFKRPVSAGNIWLRGRAVQRFAWYLGKCSGCGSTVRKKERLILIKADEFTQEPLIRRPLRIAFHGEVFKTDIKRRDLEILTVSEGKNIFEAHISDPYQIQKDELFLTQGSRVSICAGLRKKKRLVYTVCEKCGRAAAVYEDIRIVEPEEIRLEVVLPQNPVNSVKINKNGGGN